MLDKIRKLNTVKFILTMTVVAFVVKIGTYLAVALIGEYTGSRLLLDMTSEEVDYDFGIELLYGALIIAPVWETIVGQWVPIYISKILFKANWIAILLSSLFFAVLHDTGAILTGFSVGVILAWSFLQKREKDRFEAFAITSAIHFCHNGLALIIAYFVL